MNKKYRKHSQKIILKASKKVSLKIITAIMIAATSVFLYSCRKENHYDPNFNSNFPSTSSNSIAVIQTGEAAEGCIEFAPQTRNPYSIQNMDSALHELIDSGEFECDYTKFQIRPTHKYIRFEPQDTLQYDELNDDSTLILFDYPLDRRITRGGTYYRDPNIPEGQPNYQWCCVKYNHILPNNIPYLNLGDLYLPEQDPLLVEYYNTPFDGCINLLINQAMKRTHNFDTLSDIGTQTFGGSNPTAKIKIKLSPPPKWSPKGTIRIYDDVLNTKIGLIGAKVRANRWFETRESITNANGFFDIGQEFRYDVDYSIKWERANFHIRSGTLGQAYFNGPHQKGDWNMDLEKVSSTEYGVSWVYGHVHRAAIRYHYDDIGGVKRPGEKNIRFWVYNDRGRGRNYGNQADAGYEKVRIWRFKSNMDKFTSDELFSTSIHEMGHLSHRKLMTSNITFNSVSDGVSEGYSVGLEWLITQIEYRSRGITNFSGPSYSSNSSYPIDRAFQYWTKSTDGDKYTCLFIDLIDNYNQYSSSTSYVNDQVNKFELKEIEKILKNVKDLGDLKNQLQNIKPSGVTNAQISDLIDQF